MGTRAVLGSHLTVLTCATFVISVLLGGRHDGLACGAIPALPFWEFAHTSGVVYPMADFAVRGDYYGEASSLHGRYIWEGG
jgi:hypothetical protein